MSFNYNNILNIPARSIVNKKITKAFFLKNFVLSATEKKLLAKIENMMWMASIKPGIANVTEVINKLYSYEELQIMICSVTENNLNATKEKYQALFQKYIPYQIVLIIENNNEFVVNTCDKRINQNDATKRTIENYYTTPVLPKLYKNNITTAFFSAINYSNINKTNLELTYKSYSNAIIQLQAANITGTYKKRTHKRTGEDMVNLLAIEKLENEIVGLKSQIKKEQQLNQKVDLNVKLQNKRKEIEEIKNKLSK